MTPNADARPPLRSTPLCEPDGHCITCSDEAIPMRIVETANGGVALCEAEGGGRVEVLVGLVDDVVPGDLVLVHAGAALARIEAAEGPRREREVTG